MYFQPALLPSEIEDYAISFMRSDKHTDFEAASSAIRNALLELETYITKKTPLSDLSYQTHIIHLRATNALTCRPAPSDSIGMFETSAIVQQDLDWQKLTDKQREELGRFFLVQQEEERKMLDQLEKTLEVPKGKSERMIKAETGLSEELKKNMQEAQFHRLQMGRVHPLGYFCTVCKADGDEVKLQRCAQCHVPLYCSRDCQVKGWEEHKKECKKYKQVLEQQRATIDRLKALLSQ